MTRTIFKAFGALGAALVLGSVSNVHAAPVSFNFSITATEGSATGNFTGNDIDGSGSLSSSEVTSFSISATGTALTGPISIAAADAVLRFFSFDLNTLDLGFTVSNGLSQGMPGYKLISCTPCAAGRTFFVQGNGVGSGNVITGSSVTAIGDVPEPASLAMVGLALAGIALSRRSKH